MRSTETGVLIAGAGPVGLLLACELRRSGVPVTVVERLASPMTESRASQLSTRTAELLHERSFDTLLDPAANELTTHFGGLPLDLSGLDSDYRGHWKVPQYRTEAVFAERAVELGVQLLRGHDLTGLTEADDHVRATVDTPAGCLAVAARYVVGCDGAESTVRRLAGFGTGQTAATRELLRADVTGIAVADRRFERLPGGFAVAATRGGVTRIMVHAFGQAVTRRSYPPEFAEVARLWKQVTRDDIFAGTAIWVDAFGNGMGQARTYRQGRILLAGDSAHWHLPIGGQALNVGLQDAVNLGWKLAWTVCGLVPPGVLDSYQRERHPAAKRVLDYVAAQEFLLLGGPGADELRALLAELIGLGPVRDHLASAAAGLDDYPAGGTGDALTGRRLPWRRLRTPAGLVTATELLAGGTQGALLRVPHPARTRTSAAIRLDDGRRLRTVWAVPEPAGVLGEATTVLLRPDGYVAWAGDEEDDLRAAIQRWYGHPL